MNIDRGKTQFTPMERLALRDEMLAYRDRNSYTWSRIAQKCGVGHSTLSALCSANMDLARYSDEMFAKLHRFFLMAATQAELDEVAPIVPPFQLTKTAHRIHSLMNWARRGKIVVIVAAPGIGKTAATDQYCATTQNAWKATASPASSSTNAMLLTALRAMKTNRVGGSGLQLSEMLRDKTRNRQGVLIYDEAQHLSDGAFEELRGVHDETKVGLVLTGNRDVLTRIEGTSRGIAFAQFFRRVSYRLVIDVPHPDDVTIMLAAWKVSHPKERAFLTTIAMRPGGGAIGQMSQVLELATILAQQEGDERRLNHIEDAASELNASRRAA